MSYQSTIVQKRGTSLIIFSEKQNKQKSVCYLQIICQNHVTYFPFLGCPQAVRVKYEPGHNGGAYSKVPQIYGCYRQGGDTNVGMQLGLKEVALLDMPS